MAATGFGYASESEGMGTISDINVTPLVDVVLVLLIIMMVAAPMIVNQPSIKVEPPQAKTGTPTESSSFSITLAKKKDGSMGYDLFIGQTPVSEAELTEKVKQEVSKNPEFQVVILGDKGIAYGDVMHILDKIQELGVRKFSMVTDGN